MQFWSLEGLVRYEEVADLQRALVERRALGIIPDTVLFLEHEPVVTRGRGLQWTGVARERSIPLSAPLPPSIAFAESERGGDLTYHGPGQLVMYPIIKLDGSGFGPERDIAQRWEPADLGAAVTELLAEQPAQVPVYGAK